MGFLTCSPHLQRTFRAVPLFMKPSHFASAMISLTAHYDLSILFMQVLFLDYFYSFKSEYVATSPSQFLDVKKDNKELAVKASTIFKEKFLGLSGRGGVEGASHQLFSVWRNFGFITTSDKKLSNLEISYRHLRNPDTAQIYPNRENSKKNLQLTLIFDKWIQL